MAATGTRRERWSQLRVGANTPEECQTSRRMPFSGMAAFGEIGSLRLWEHNPGATAQWDLPRRRRPRYSQVPCPAPRRRAARPPARARPSGPELYNGAQWLPRSW